MEIKYHGKTLSETDALQLYNPYVKLGDGCSFFKYNMKKTEISLCMNWHYFASDAVSKKYKTVMMWESDVLFNDDFMENLEKAMNLLPESWDFLSLSAGACLIPERDQTQERTLGWFPSLHNTIHTRTTDAMIFRVEMLKKITEGDFFPIGDVLDWELNYQLSQHNSKTLWLDPPIIRQGSGTVYETSL